MPDPLGLVNPSGNAGVSPLRPGSAGAPGPAPEMGFKQVLMDNIEQVNRLQQDAQMAIEDLSAGRREDVASVMIAKQKADLAFQMLLQVRNKLVDAYEEIKQIRV